MLLDEGWLDDKSNADLLNLSKEELINYFKFEGWNNQSTINDISNQ